MRVALSFARDLAAVVLRRLVWTKLPSQAKPRLSRVELAENFDLLSHAFGMDREHSRHPEDNVAGGNEGSGNARQKKMVARRVFYHARADEHLTQFRHVSELLKTRIKQGVTSEQPIVLVDLIFCNGVPQPGYDQFSVVIYRV